jgi:Ala-tRNA(Pro) deacylase
MAVALTLQQYLSDQGIGYELMTHALTKSASATAQASHVPADRLAKGVVLTREGGYVMAVLPASRTVRLDAIEEILHCPVGLATEDEVSSLFPDCETGAIPPLGAAYALECIVDENFEREGDVYLEGGDHRTLIHVTGQQFRDLMRDVPHGHIAREA